MTLHPHVTIGEVLRVCRDRVEPSEHAHKAFNFVGLEHIESHTGQLLPIQHTTGSEIKSTKNVFRKGQILYNKLRPYLNKVHLTKEEGICSTDIYVLEPRNAKLSPSYAAYYLRSPFVLQRVEGLTAGANLPRISEESLLGISIPLPPLYEQERIVRILDEAEELRKLRTQADRRTADLIHAISHNMFGDPATNPKGWNTSTMGELTSFITSGSRGWAKYYSNKGAKFIRVQNLTGHQLIFDDIAYVYPPDNAESKRTKIHSNDLLVTITGVVGLVAIADPSIGDAYVSQHVAIVRLCDGMDVTFAAAFLSDPAGGQRQIAEFQYGQTKPGLNLNQIRSIRIYLPPLSLQREFAARVAEIRAMEAQQAASCRKLDDLFQSLLHQAFCG